MTRCRSDVVLGLLILAVLVGEAPSIRARQQPAMEHGDHRTPAGRIFTGPKGDRSKERDTHHDVENGRASFQRQARLAEQSMESAP